MYLRHLRSCDVEKLPPKLQFLVSTARSFILSSGVLTSGWLLRPEQGIRWFSESESSVGEKCCDCNLACRTFEGPFHCKSVPVRRCLSLTLVTPLNSLSVPRIVPPGVAEVRSQQLTYCLKL